MHLSDDLTGRLLVSLTQTGCQIKSQINKIQINENKRLENFGKDSGSLKTVH